MILAPFAPFLADELYQKLTGGESVHLLDWPLAGHINELAVRDMAFVRSIINEGLSQRAKAQLKVRQPLESVSVLDIDGILNDELKEVIAEELNVKKVFTHTRSEVAPVVMNTEITPELQREGLMREVIRHVQNSRKKAELQVDDRIKLSLKASGAVLEAINTYEQLIAEETLATSIDYDSTYNYSAEVKLDGVELVVSLQKA